MLSFGMNDAIVVDTNVVVSALLNPDTAPRAVLRACLAKSVKPLMGNALFAEYGSVIGRESIFANSPLSLDERLAFLDDFYSVCDWVSVYYLWRPNLPDEADNHVLELAVAGGARAIVTGNPKDFERTALRFPDIESVSPREFVNRGGS